MLGKIFERFVEKSPMSVMARALLERVLNSKTIDEIFERVADCQYTRTLLFSVVFDLMSRVVCGSRKTLHAAYQASPQKISVSVTSIYNKVDGIETQTSASLVRYCADTVTPVIDQIGGALPPLLTGYRIKILDGNCLDATEHRLRELRGTAAGPLPSKSPVVLDPLLKLMIDVFPCEDGRTQERALLEQVLPTVEAKDCWIEDRNFCTINFLFNVNKQDAFFIVRQHQNLPWDSVDKSKKVGRIDGAQLRCRNNRLLSGIMRVTSSHQFYILFTHYCGSKLSRLHVLSPTSSRRFRCCVIKLHTSDSCQRMHNVEATPYVGNRMFRFHPFCGRRPP